MSRAPDKKSFKGPVVQKNVEIQLERSLLVFRSQRRGKGVMHSFLILL